MFEITIRSLPVVHHMRIGMTSRFKAEHLVNKQLVRRVTLNRGVVPENFALYASHVQSLAFCVYGWHMGCELGAESW